MPNRLAKETSPYLLQHKDNPVDWYPWCSEALQRAQTEDKPIFLSIGYSACHWCHVMEHESFEDESIARVLNENFVCIKVDREERPDLDQIYMNAVMALQNGRGGWPLNVFLTPQQHVFFGGTYWPPRTRVGMPGFDQVLHGVLDAFTARRDKVEEQSRQITSWLANVEASPMAGSSLNDAWLSDAVSALERNFDTRNGGFGGAPKFPHSMDLALLVRMAQKANRDSVPSRERILKMVRISLKKMAYGGIFDHLAGGFARYSVDEFWLVPHFEKMLYDNALLAGVYLDMYRETHDPFFAMVARKTLDYLKTYMLDELGGIHSTEDADSEGVEGKFYVWSKNEVIDHLGQETGVRFCDLYNVTEAGNFEGSNILNMTKSYQEFSDEIGVGKAELREEMRTARSTLLKVRDKRVRPGKDDKIITSWNALAISAFSKGAIWTGNREYLQIAKDAALFAKQHLRRADGRLLHSYRKGKATLDGYLDDYAFLINALLDLHQATSELEWVEWALQLAELMVKHFSDDETGGFYFTADDHEQLIARMKSFQDSSVPSGNSLAALSLIRLGRTLGREDLILTGHKTISAATGLMERSLLASGQMLIAMDCYLRRSVELVAVLPKGFEDEEKLLLIKRAMPMNASLIVLVDDESVPDCFGEISSGKHAKDNQPTLYICSGQSCQLPAVGWEAILAAVSELDDVANHPHVES